MLEISLNLDFDQLRNLYNHQIREHLSKKWKSTFKSLTFAFLLLTTSVLMFVFSGIKYHFVPWNIVSGITGLFFLFKAIINQSKGLIEVKKLKAETESYISNLEQTKSIAYKVTDQVIEYFVDDEIEYSIEWARLSSIIEKEGYFYLFFSDPDNHILMPKFAVTHEFYSGFLQLAKRKNEVTLDE